MRCGAASACVAWLAVKVNIEGIEHAWRKLQGDVLLIDDRGVVILSTRDELKYRPLAPLQAAQRAEVERFPVLRRGEPATAGLDRLPKPVRGCPARQARRALSHLASTRGLHQTPWSLIVLDDLAPVHELARWCGGDVEPDDAGRGIGHGHALAASARRAMGLASQAALQAAHDSLESTVVARTEQLRAAQSDLVHAGKLAALGQMSAGMVHELNQPLTALRTLADSAGVLLDQQRPDDVRGNLRRITDMVDRLARLTPLKTFAYKSDAPLAPCRWRAALPMHRPSWARS